MKAWINQNNSWTSTVTCRIKAQLNTESFNLRVQSADVTKWRLHTQLLWRHCYDVSLGARSTPRLYVGNKPPGKAAVRASLFTERIVASYHVTSLKCGKSGHYWVKDDIVWQTCFSQGSVVIVYSQRKHKYTQLIFCAMIKYSGQWSLTCIFYVDAQIIDFVWFEEVTPNIYLKFFITFTIIIIAFITEWD